MQPALRSNREVLRSVIPYAMLAGVLALAASLLGVGGASAQDYVLPMQPFPVVRIAGEGTRTGANVSKLTVKGPVAAVVVTTCKPRSKCPYTQRSQLIPGPIGATRTIHLSSLQRRYRAGASLRVFVVKAGFIGKYASFAIRRGTQPRRFDYCVRETALKPIRCAAS